MFGFIRRAFGTNNEPTETRNLPGGYDLIGGLMMLGSYGSADAGVTVTPETAMTAAAVHACVGRISRDISTLPVHVVDRDNNQRVSGHPIARLLRNPNEMMTGPVFMQSYAMNTLLYGNGYAFIERAGPDPIGLLPMQSRAVYPRRRDGVLFYQSVAAGKGLRVDEVVHTPYMPIDGIVGQSPISIAARTIGTAIALDTFAARYFKNGGAVGTVFELPPMSQDAATDTANRLRDQYAGLENAHRIVAMPQIKPHRVGHSARESQSVEARDFQLREVARVFGVPVGIIDPEKSKYAGLEAQYRDYAQATLRPWAVLLEAELSRKLLSEDDQDRYRVQFNLDGFVRASLADRADADTKLVAGGILTPNEAREHHDRPPLEGGDTLLSPLNMTPASDRAKQDQTEPKPTPDAQLRAMLEATAESVALKESNAARTAAKRQDDFAGWATGWFADHINHLRQRYPILTDDQAQHLAAEARDAFVEAHKAGELETLLEDWPKRSKATICTILIEGTSSNNEPDQSAA
ncbi:MAG: phage portal protein [Planctomycetota bacterium]